MLAILMSIRARHTADIINELKKRELRKKFPKHYRGWVYIYCCKDHCLVNYPCPVTNRQQYLYVNRLDHGTQASLYALNAKYLEGKVVARFWVDDVTEYINGGRWNDDNTFGSYDDYIKDKVCEEACITEEELFAYSDDLAFSSIHISKLEVFEEPKELFEFGHFVKAKRTKDDIEFEKMMGCKTFYGSKLMPLKRPPQSWQYVEVTL